MAHKALSEGDESEEEKHLEENLPSSISVSEFVNQILKFDNRPIDQLVEAMKHTDDLNWKLLRFISFRKYEMNVKKESVHRCLGNN